MRDFELTKQGKCCLTTTKIHSKITESRFYYFKEIELLYATEYIKTYSYITPDNIANTYSKKKAK